MNPEKIKEEFAQLWKMTLETEEDPSDEDDFFDCGGNSYKAFFIITNMPEEYKGMLEMGDFYDCETFGSISCRMAERMNQE